MEFEIFLVMRVMMRRDTFNVMTGSVEVSELELLLLEKKQI